jgi:hypothetical protein
MYNDPSLKNRYYVWFAIYDFDCHPDEITKEIGITPSEIRIKGEIRTSGKKKYKLINKQNSWRIESDLPRNIPIEKHLENVLTKLRPHTQNIIKVTEKYYAEFGCASYYYEANPGIHIDHKLLKEITDLHAEIDLDMYCLTGTVQELAQPKVVKHLTNHLKDIKFLTQYSDKKHNEVETLIGGLKEIEEAAYKIEANMHDLIWNYKPSDKDFEPTFKSLGNNLQNIFKNIKKSQFLTKLVNDAKL